MNLHNCEKEEWLCLLQWHLENVLDRFERHQCRRFQIIHQENHQLLCTTTMTSDKFVITVKTKFICSWFLNFNGGEFLNGNCGGWWCEAKNRGCVGGIKGKTNIYGKLGFHVDKLCFDKFFHCDGVVKCTSLTRWRHGYFSNWWYFEWI